MTKEEILESLKKEGFTSAHVIEGYAHAQYPKGYVTQPALVVVLQGNLICSVNGRDHVIQTGERFTIPVGAPYFLICGPEGCTFISTEN